MALYCRMMECEHEQTEICSDCGQAACLIHGAWMTANDFKTRWLPGELLEIAIYEQLCVYVCLACAEARGIIPETGLKVSTIYDRAARTRPQVQTIRVRRDTGA